MPDPSAGNGDGIASASSGSGDFAAIADAIVKEAKFLFDTATSEDSLKENAAFVRGKTEPLLKQIAALPPTAADRLAAEQRLEELRTFYSKGRARLRRRAMDIAWRNSVDDIVEEAVALFGKADSKHALDEAKSLTMGRKLKPLLKQLTAFPPGVRPGVGQQLNELRAKLLQLYEEGRRRLQQRTIDAALKEGTDVSLPGRTAMRGGCHPLSLATERAATILAGVGFETADGPEIETDYYNFTALNHPENHPARSMHDTFYTADNRLLRTHTSPVQIRHMLARKTPPIRAIAPGRVYRCDHDATHSPMFHQIEGIWIDDSVSFAHLKGVLGGFFRSFFDDDNIVVRFRPSFFPFTEPSAECDIFKNGKWLEVAGCGMIHPNVLQHGGMDPERFRGFAFGMGVERLAMLLYGVADIRLFYENDARFLAQFAGE